MPTSYELLWGLSSQSWICSSGIMFLLTPLFGYTTIGANQVMFCCGLIPDIGHVGLGPLQRDFCEDQGWPLPVTGPGLPGRSFKVICSCSLPVLDLKA